MKQPFDYDFMFNQALQRIRAIRNPNASNPYAIDYDVKRQILFDYGGDKFTEYSAVITAANNVSQSILIEIIRCLFEHYHVNIKNVEYDKTGLLANCLLCVHDKTTNSILIFKDIEESSVFKLRHREPDEVQSLINDNHALSCKYIYLMRDKAYLQIIGHNDDSNDPGRGYNAYALKWLFEVYFSESEYSYFIKALDKYENSVRENLGYSVIRSLSPQSLINFRRITENEVLKFDYDELKRISVSDRTKIYTISDPEYNKLITQFINLRYYSVMIANHDFAESLITAEWLRDSMKKAQAIDLTAVGMGYFKAVEQMLYELICLDKTESRYIKSINSKDKIKLTQENIEQDKIDFSIGSMAVFYRDNLDLLRSDISIQSKKYIREMIFRYKDLRNGYLHKDNIHELTKIEEIRKASFYMMFLMLGAYNLSNADLIDLGKPSNDMLDDYYKLCEYMNYHSNEVFFVQHNGIENVFLGCDDLFTEIIDDKYIKYSGAFIRELGENGKRYKITKGNLPDAIYLGKLDIHMSESEQIKISPIKIKKIFENGIFVGDSIAGEIKEY